ncbi:uncharacterized protein FOBCDRAFT_251504 [Fusarium oxysporum Fo47]|uniref:uncharacterized protein n=1 Tax=Fusarium oxysporum Fo47 TaxID=660027 RepID=UPI002869A473|nr:uncharacterized protein FOBCDRAFT_251504 [Fusarium oxysporum Fo47]QKD56364.2 hypothetical protein FOBCDRAFT_251504 [Fusarium oxysporum Fo47]
MATTTSIDRLLLTELPTDLPWPPGAARQMWAVELKRDWKYLDTTDDVPGAWRGRMPTDLLVNGRLPLFNKEPGYMFFRGNNTAMVLFFKGTKKIPVVLPLSILNIGAKFRTLAEQTVELLPAPVSSIAPQTQSITQNNDSILERFIRTLWWTFATVPNQLRGLGATNEDLALCFGGQNLRQNVDAIYAAFIPDVLNVLKDGRFSLKNILDLRHVSPHWPGRPTIYLRVYTHPRGQPNGTYRDTSQADINHHVGFYVGKSILPWVRHRDHERRTDSCDGVYEGHYQIARKSRKEHRHMIPLMTFDERTPTHILKMAEQTMMIVLRTYHPLGTNAVQSSIYTVSRTFRGFGHRLAQNKAPWLQHKLSDPPDARFGYLVFEVMDDHKPHDRAWLGVPSVGQYVNFDEASCFSVRFEWFDEGQQTWLSMPMYRYYKGYTEMSGYAERLDVEKALAPWRLAMDVLQAIEGRVYTEPLDGFPERLSILHARKLEINHLAQKYRWVSRESRAPRPVPAYAIWDDNFRLIKRLFDTDLTHIATTEPYEKQSDVMNREAGDQRRVKGVHKCDTCTYMGVGMKCIRDERRTDVWASRFSQHPTGPHRFLAYHNSMTPAQLCEATRVPVPLPEHLLEEAEGEEEGSGDDAQGDGDLGSGEE